MFVAYLDIIYIIIAVIMLTYVSILIMAVMTIITGRWLESIYEIVVNCV